MPDPTTRTGVPSPGAALPDAEGPGAALPDAEDAEAEDARASDAGASDADLTARIAELEDRWRRAAADLDNVRKRVAGESARQREAERARVTSEWLPVVDNLDLALTHPDADAQSLLEGIRAIRNQALAVVSRLGYLRYGEPGVPFDPARHEVVATEPAPPDVPAGTVVRVVRPGYGADERQLRPAAVVVATRGE
jgi:molecular chaperone GrpE